MKARVTFKKNQSGNYKPRMILTYNGTQCKCAYDIDLDPYHWDQKNQEVLSSLKPKSVRDLLNHTITTDRLKLQEEAKIRYRTQPITADWMGSILNGTTQKGEGLFDLYQDMIDSLSQGAKPQADGSIRGAERARDLLQEFNPRLSVEMLTTDLMDDFAGWLIRTYPEMKFNTRRNILGRVMRFFRWLPSRNLSNLNMNFAAWKLPTARETQELILDWSEVEMIDAYKPQSKIEEWAKDIFVLNCYMGLRVFSELPRLNLNEDGTGQVFTKKNKRNMTTGIPTRAAEILAKYDGHIKLRKSESLTLNKYLKQVARKAGLAGTIQTSEESKPVARWEKMASHVSRRTFGRAWVKGGGSLESLMEYFHHSKLEQTKKYIGYGALETASNHLSIFNNIGQAALRVA